MHRVASIKRTPRGALLFGPRSYLSTSLHGRAFFFFHWAVKPSIGIGRYRMGTESKRAFSYSASGPSSPSKSWERSARMVKNTDTTNQYLDSIRESHDPALHLKTIEDELRSTMGQALGRQGEKILYAMRGMQEAREQYEALLEASHTSALELRKCAKRHNQYREDAKQARWELMVHRQAVGFIVDNHRFVMEKFPIGDPLPVSDNDESEYRHQDREGNPKHSGKKKFGDQLDWWQRIGRWK